MTGGWSRANINDDQVQQMAAFATESLTAAVNAKSPLKLASITSASKQVVSGMNWKIRLELKDGNSPLYCEAIIYDQPWTSTRKMTGYNCDNN